MPGDILDDIPCKYVDGALICEVSLLLWYALLSNLVFNHTKSYSRVQK